MAQLNSIGLRLFSGSSASPTDEVCKIKTIPDLGGAPSAVEVTDLTDTYQRYEQGVQALSQLEFTANYDETTYKAVLAKCSTDTYFRVAYGTIADNDGIFAFQGSMAIFPTAVGVDGKPEFKIIITPSTVPAIE
jgi:hypothetical protein